MPDGKPAAFSPWSTLIDRAADIVDQFVEDKDAVAKAKHDLAVLQIEGEQELRRLQAQANIEAAKHGSIFVAGARPAVIWGLLFLLMYNYAIHPFLLYLGAFFPEANFAELPKPIEDTETIFYFISGLLGMGGWRSMDKAKGVAREHL